MKPCQNCSTSPKLIEKQQNTSSEVHALTGHNVCRQTSLYPVYETDICVCSSDKSSMLFSNCNKQKFNRWCFTSSQTSKLVSAHPTTIQRYTSHSREQVTNLLISLLFQPNCPSVFGIIDAHSRQIYIQKYLIDIFQVELSSSGYQKWIVKNLRNIQD